MKKLIFVLPFFLSFSIQSQHNELKIDVFGFLIEEINLSFEREIKEELGFELAIGYLFQSETLDTFDYTNLPTTPTTFKFLNFKKRSFSFLTQVKRYIVLKPRGNKIMFGGFVKYQTKPKIEDAYHVAYENHFNEPDPFPPNDALIVGGVVGLKILIFKKKIVIEPMFGLGLDMFASDFDKENGSPSFDGFLRLNLGYRFAVGGKEN